MRRMSAILISSYSLFLLLQVDSIVHAMGDQQLKMYWSDRVANTIRRADVDGSDIELLVSGLGQARGVAVDFDNEMLYWADNGTDKIQRSGFDDMNVEDLVVDGLDFPAGIDLDVNGGKMYWADRDTKKIQRANLDGTNVEDLVTGLGLPYYIRLDLFSDHIYWTDFGTDKIQRANLDGSNVVDLVTTGLDLPRGIDLDPVNGKMYWADRGNDTIKRANLDGTNIETLHTVIPPVGVDSAPHGVALDVANGHVYWVDNGTVKIQRSNLDGSDVIDILTADSGVLSRPWEIVLNAADVPSICADADCIPPDHGRQIDLITQLILAEKFNPEFDLDNNNIIDHSDRETFIEQVLGTQFGDSNLDGMFDTRDFVHVFQAGEYEDDLLQNSTWSNGDWSGDFEFDTRDMVVAFQAGGFEAVATASVPEPASALLLSLGLITCLARFRDKRETIIDQDHRDA